MRKSLVLTTALLASGSVLAAPLAAWSSPQPRETGGRTVKCEVANFRGEAEVSWEIRGDHLSTSVDSYRITRLNGQSGGNKANLNHRITGKDYSGWAFEDSWASSSDSMQQDGLWHTLGQTRNRDVSDDPTLFAQVEFVFDRTGPDPKCRVSAPIRG